MSGRAHQPTNVRCVWAAELRGGIGMRLVNHGLVMGSRPEGAFVHVAVVGTKWNPVTGTQVPAPASLFFHSTDDVWVEDEPTPPPTERESRITADVYRHADDDDDGFPPQTFPV